MAAVCCNSECGFQPCCLQRAVRPAWRDFSAQLTRRLLARRATQRARHAPAAALAQVAHQVRTRHLDQLATPRCAYRLLARERFLVLHRGLRDASASHLLLARRHVWHDMQRRLFWLGWLRPPFLDRCNPRVIVRRSDDSLCCVPESMHGVHVGDRLRWLHRFSRAQQRHVLRHELRFSQPPGASLNLCFH